MPSSQGYLDFVLDQLSGAEGIGHRAMMGEYLLYVHGKVFGGIYDDRLLVKDVPAARERLPGAEPEAPYPGGKPMLPAVDMDDREKLQALVQAMSPQLPEPKRKR